MVLTRVVCTSCFESCCTVSACDNLENVKRERKKKEKKEGGKWEKAFCELTFVFFLFLCLKKQLDSESESAEGVGSDGDMKSK